MSAGSSSRFARYGRADAARPGSEQRLAARVLCFLLAGSAVIFLASALFFNDASGRSVVLAGGAWFAGSAAVVRARGGRLSPMAFHLLLAGATVAIAVPVAFVDGGRNFRLLLIWVTLFAALFMRPSRIAAHLAFTAGTYAAVLLFGREWTPATLDWFVPLGVLAMTTPFVYAVRRERERTRISLSSVIDSSPLAMVAVDERGAVSVWSRKAEELFGWTECDVLERRNPAVPEAGNALSEELRLRAFSGETVTGVRVQRQRRDGSLVDVNLSVAPLRSGPDSVDAALFLYEDVTEKLRSEEEAGAQRRRAEAIFEASLDPVLLFDDDLLVVDANTAAAELIGRPRDELIGSSGASIVASISRRGLEHRLSALFEWGTARADLTIVTADGTTRTVDSASRANILPGLHVIVLRDMTERRQLERQLRQSQKMDALGHLAGGVAHDFNNLLTVIGVHCELALEETGSDDTRARLTEIARAAERAGGLTRQLLSFSRDEPGTSAELVEIGGVLGETDSMLRRVLGRGIDLLTVLDIDAPMVRIDPTQLQQILMNLALNARDAMPEGGELRITTESVELSSSDGPLGLAPGPFIKVTVSDSGVGMQPEVAPRVFEPFFTTKPSGEGTGLGLATVYGIVRRAGGHIDLRTAPGAGTSFEILLPAATDGATAAGPARSKAGAPEHRTGSVLVVDDDDDVRELVCEVLEASGYAAHPATDGQTARELLDWAPIDLLVTDVVMPREGGRELASAVRETHPGLPVLFMSAYPAEGDGRLEPLLRKPFTRAELLESVEAARLSRSP